MDAVFLHPSICKVYSRYQDKKMSGYRPDIISVLLNRYLVTNILPEYTLLGVVMRTKYMPDCCVMSSTVLL